MYREHAARTIISASAMPETGTNRRAYFVGCYAFDHESYLVPVKDGDYCNAPLLRAMRDAIDAAETIRDIQTALFG